MHIPLFATGYQHRTVGHRHASNPLQVIPRPTLIFRCVLEDVFPISRLSAISRLLRVYWRSHLESARLWILAWKAFRMRTLRVSPLESVRHLDRLGVASKNRKSRPQFKLQKRTPVEYFYSTGESVFLTRGLAECCWCGNEFNRTTNNNSIVALNVETLQPRKYPRYQWGTRE
jgi:hypothetical protein